MVQVAIIGSGAIGLSVALRLKEELGSRVDFTVISEYFLQQTTSYGSGGLWEPYQIAGGTNYSFICIYF
jgi:glycine/D-amino acid oxidase-like deaminating enzyme